ncbi:glycoside hydrolase family 97 protein [Flavihumibacter petaseus]|uniref:Putative alpha-galactosidase n=1 Tax=Flavihumibacter petaseus NBRC 106054 TaxID=1220578 RepID=A0A0E9MXI3_9BACT|nr:glycoside hydrolase family 97 protein [Flavihumibacter petaseus]GAO42131.1 putative alpha-galactosidase [Flavihumibacter petaseus NBRC 106054]
MRYFLFLLLLIAGGNASAKDWKLNSPNGAIVITLSAGQTLSWSVSYKQQPVLLPSTLSMTLGDGQVLGRDPKLVKATTRSVNGIIEAAVPVKTRIIPEVFNELRLQWKGNYTLVIRAYNDGVAYRFETSLPASTIEVRSEQADFNFSDNHRVFWPTETNKEFLSHFESLYKDSVLAAFDSSKHGALPFLVKVAHGPSLLVTESDLHDYPNLFLKGTSGNKLEATFPKVILGQQQVGDRQIKITQLASYIAKTNGNRNFPWRCIAIAPDDNSLLENNLVYKLASPSVITSTAWIKPGKVAWDWWNANNIYGVDFEAGLNTATYKYFIDFAAAYGLEYIVLDEGWSASTTNLLQSRKEIDLPELVAYGKSKGVSLILWALWDPLDKDMANVLDQFARWGVKGVKVDFMARADQYMVNYYERVAAEAAKRELLVDLHGAFKPVGLNRKYPNVLNYEGVRGLENDKWGDEITPRHDVTLPFTRMAAGPMDYTPGAMRNATRINFRSVFTEPMSQGTRAHQAAMYVIYEAPLQMLADNPSSYLKEPDFTSVIAQVPTVWDTTIAIAGEAGSYVAIARKKGNNWYIGAMTDWNERTLPVSLTFLGKGNYRMTAIEDGINANQHAADYRRTEKTVTAGEELKIFLKKGGGWLAILKPE